MAMEHADAKRNDGAGDLVAEVTVDALDIVADGDSAGLRAFQAIIPYIVL